ncbi:MAG TPA: DUF4190 domain-containing protein [Ktedonobacterales bacterium]|nr:DUF4190 domain-containing protein [Ktedonobacterales bacterium]
MARWPRLELTPGQLAQIKNGQMLTETLVPLDPAQDGSPNPPPGDRAHPTNGPRVAGAQQAPHGAQAASPALMGTLNQVNQPTGQLVGAAVRVQQNAALPSTQAIRVAGPMSGSGVAAAAPAPAPHLPTGAVALRTPPAPPGIAATPTMRLSQGRRLAGWAVFVSLLGLVAAFAPLVLPVLMIISVIIGAIAIMLGASAQRRIQSGLPGRGAASTGLALGVIDVLVAIVLTVVSTHAFSR